MSDGLIKSAAKAHGDEIDNRRMYGVMIGQVVGNKDDSNSGRILVQPKGTPIPHNIPARVALPMAGKKGRGIYFMPQVGDEVVIAYHHGDASEAVVLGCLWNGMDKSPAQTKDDAADKQIIRTECGHEIELDNKKQTVTIKNAAKHKVVMDKNSVKISLDEDKTYIILDKKGAMTLKAETSITLDASKITLKGDTIEITGQTSAKIDGGSMCDILGQMVKIN